MGNKAEEGQGSLPLTSQAPVLPGDILRAWGHWLALALQLAKGCGGLVFCPQHRTETYRAVSKHRELRFFAI